MSTFSREAFNLAQFVALKPVTPDEADSPIKSAGGLGLPVYDSVTLVVDDIELELETAVVSIRQGIKLVRTNLVNGKGTVKEMIDEDDFSVSVQGAIYSNKMLKYPEDEVNKLIRILRSKKEIEISNKHCNRFDIDTVVVDNYEVPQMKGTYSVQPFSIEFLSEEPVELIINDQDA